MKRVRLGVVGCGAVSTLYHLPALRRSPIVELVAVIDSDVAWAHRVAQRFGVPEHHSDYHALMGRVDAALIATPNHTHADIACALLAAGIHVLCEKPVATTAAEVERMLSTAARVGTRLMPAHCLRFSANLAFLKQIIAAEWLGPVTEMSAGIGGPYETSAHRTDFRRRKQSAGGGVLVDLGIHLIDLATWFANGTATAVVYDGATLAGWEVETDAEVGLSFHGGARAMLTASFTYTPDSTFTVRGRHGWAAAPLYRPTELTLFTTRARVCQRAGAQQLQLPDTSMYEAQIAHFCEAVQSGREFVITARDVRAVVDIIEKCYGRQAANAA